METNEKAVNQLNTLITRNYDAEKGYKEFTEKIESSALKQLFIDYAQQRYDFGHEIKREIASLGGKVEKGTSIIGDLHRTWTKIRDAFTNNDEAVILDEVERGEHTFIEDYEKAINSGDLPVSTVTLLRSQLDIVRSTLNRVKSLKSSYQTTEA